MAADADVHIEAARRIIDESSYLTLATADAAGRPWATPVWFAHDGYRDYVWASRPGTRHSANLAVRPDTGIVVFDSTASVGSGQAVYIEARAEQVPSAQVEAALAIYSAALEADGGSSWPVSAVTGAAPFRLYLARSSAHYLLDDHDHRVPVDPRTP